jgi:hypothetical protein
MPSVKKIGYAYVIFGILILVAVLGFKLEGIKLIAGIVVGAVLTVVGLYFSTKKK